MSVKYDEYIAEHKTNVQNAYEWLTSNIPELFEEPDCKILCDSIIAKHDDSKYESDEYWSYDEYFYGGNRSYKVVNNFNHAWLHHIHHNEHHWQHWVLNNDDPDKGEIVLDMPYVYIIEMICDWWSFSWKKGNLYELFDWFKEHQEYMKLSDHTRKTVNNILDKIAFRLASSDVDDAD